MMAYIGSWGKHGRAFGHIPKCAGMTVRNHLRATYGNGREQNGWHDLPDDLEGTFVIVRHPADWLVSFYTYMRRHHWEWEALPDYVNDQFVFAYDMNWTKFVNKVVDGNPGAVGRVFDHYCKDGVTVYRLEDLDQHFPGIHHEHRTYGKPAFTEGQRDRVCRVEQVTMQKFGYI